MSGRNIQHELSFKITKGGEKFANNQRKYFFFQVSYFSSIFVTPINCKIISKKFVSRQLSWEHIRKVVIKFSTFLPGHNPAGPPPLPPPLISYRDQIRKIVFIVINYGTSHHGNCIPKLLYKSPVTILLFTSKIK